ncbi:MAG: GDP-mannose 4,6-dehydratase [Bryobacterales bacterium]|nr:GDP-mannose 4,6-dehydratase [Bryobacterales bacterium]
MDLAAERTLVTGAGGFIGSHLTEALLAMGCPVRCLVSYRARGDRGWLDPCVSGAPGLEVLAGDVRDPQIAAEAVAGCSVVFHLAALVGIPFSYRSPASYVETNVRGTLNLLQAARAAGVRRFVHTSTSEVYGQALVVPTAEDAPPRAQSPYAATKSAADQLALSFHHSFGLPVSVIRPFNTYGPRQSARAVVPAIVSQIAAGCRTIRLGALDPARDFTFVDDTVRGFIAVAGAEDAVGEVVNVGAGHEVTVAGICAVIQEVMGVSLPVEVDPARIRPSGSEILRLVADNRKAAALTGWRPRFQGPAGLRDGVRRTVAWFRQPQPAAQSGPPVYAV